MPTVRDQVVGFLMFHQNVDFCDQCLAAGLELSADQATAIAIELGSSPVFLHDRWTCRRCGRMRRVIRALPNHTLSVKGRLESRLSGRRRPAQLVPL